MNESYDPGSDPTLLSLKNSALRGGGLGPLHDQGVLKVIAEVEQKGRYTPDEMGRILALLEMERRAQVPMATQHEKLLAMHFLAEKAWTLAQGVEYASGVKDAEALLYHRKHVE